MRKKSAIKANFHSKALASGWSTEVDGHGHLRSFITVDDFWQRLHLIGYQQLQAKISDEVHASIQALTANKTRIYAAKAGNVANFRSEDTSVRAMLRAMNAPTQRFLDQARLGFEEIEAAFMSADGYWLHPGESDVHALHYEASTLSEALTAAKDIDIRYLDWMLRLRNDKTPLFQRRLASFLYKKLELEKKVFDPDYRLLCDQYDQVEPPDSLENASLKLAQLNENNKTANDFLTESKATLGHRTWPWESTIVAHHIEDPTLAMAWPYAPVFVGDESTDELLLASLNCQAAGTWMDRTMKKLIVNLFQEDSESDETYDLRNTAFHETLNRAVAKIHGAAAFLCLQAMMVEVLATPANEEARRCDLCYRRVGKRKQKYCDLHSVGIANIDKSEAVSQRTRLRQSQILAATYLKRCDALLQELNKNAFFRYPSVFFANEVSLEGDQEIDFSDPQSHIKQLEVFLSLLEPIVGIALHQELETLGNALIKSVRQAHASNQLAQHELGRSINRLNEEQSKLRRVLETKIARKQTGELPLANATAAEPDVQCLVDDATKCLVLTVQDYTRMANAAEKKLKADMEGLSILNFLKEFFSRKLEGTQQLVDASHPLAVCAIMTRHTDGHDTLASGYGFDLNQIVREDFLALRAWYEVEGKKLDQALMKDGSPLPVQRKTRKFTWEFLVECAENLRKANPSRKPTAQEIAVAISKNSNPPVQVSRSAVSQAIRRANKTLDNLTA